MKIFLPLIFALVPVDAKKNGGNKKNPGFSFFKAPKGSDVYGHEIVKKHPLRVLQSTNKTFCKLVIKELDNKKQALRVCDRWTSAITSYAESFDRTRCSFFDPSVPKGGPNSMADEGKRLNDKGEWVERRMRREIDYFVNETDFEEYDEEDEDNLTDCDGNETGIWKDICEGNFEAAAGEGDVTARRKKKKGPKLSKPQRRMRKITGTLAQWCDRHIYNCYGQRAFDHCKNRSAGLLLKLMPLLPQHVPKNN